LPKPFAKASANATLLSKTVLNSSPCNLPEARPCPSCRENEKTSDWTAPAIARVLTEASVNFAIVSCEAANRLPDIATF